MTTRALALSLAALLLASNVGHAADLGHASDMVVPTAATPFNWSGVYFGGTLGGAWGNAAIVFTNGSPARPINPSGWLGGGFVGAQGQWGNWVLGVEGKLLGGSITGSNLCFNTIYTCTVANVSPIVVIGPRIGYAWDRWLVYGTGGYAGGSVATHTFITATGLDSDNTNVWQNGWALGGGLDYAVTSRLTFGVEYLHLNFANTLHTSSINPGNSAYDHNLSASVDSVLARIAWKFN